MHDTLGRSDDPAVALQRQMVLGAVVTALCDINAQVENQPLSAWLGAVPRPSVELYANINRAPVDRSSEEFASIAADAVAAGFDRIKLAPFDGAGAQTASSGTLETGISHLKAVRNTIGPEPTILVDVHHRLADHELEPAVRAMEELEVGWIEDAVDVRQPAQLERLAAMTDIPIAGGEQLTDQSDIAQLCDGGWLDFLLLDPKYIGGPLRFKTVLDVVHDVSLTLHDPTGPISTAVSSHLTMLSDDPGPLEYAFGEKLDRNQITIPGELLEANHVVVGDRSGIGTRLDVVSIPTVTSSRWDL
jgi:galactonate dehydratase